MLTQLNRYQRVGIFVDAQNMFHSAKHLRAKLDYMKLMEAAVRGRQLIRAITYIVENKDSDLGKFIDMLKGNGYEIKSKPLRTRADGSAKGDWDMGMAIDAIAMADKLDVIIIVSGDGDFTDLINHLKSKGVFVEVMSFPGSTNTDLIDAANHYTAIDDDLLIRNKRHHKHG